jgi:hypothetical protein
MQHTPNATGAPHEGRGSRFALSGLADFFLSSACSRRPRTRTIFEQRLSFLASSSEARGGAMPVGYMLVLLLQLSPAIALSMRPLASCRLHSRWRPCTHISSLLTLGDDPDFDPFADSYPAATVEEKKTSVRLSTTAGDCFIVVDRVQPPRTRTDPKSALDMLLPC